MRMQSIDTLINARWIIPVEPGGIVLDHHSLAIHQGRIVAIVPTAHAAQRYSPAATVDRSTHVVLPGFINAHTHATAKLLRGLVEDLEPARWLERLAALERQW